MSLLEHNDMNATSSTTGQDVGNVSGRWTEPVARSGCAGIRRRLRTILPSFVEVADVLDGGSDPLRAVGRVLRESRSVQAGSVSVILKLTPASAELLRDRGPGWLASEMADGGTVSTPTRCRSGGWRLASATEQRPSRECHADGITEMLTMCIATDAPYVSASVHVLVLDTPGHEGCAILALIPDRGQAIYREWI